MWKRGGRILSFSFGVLCRSGDETALFFIDSVMRAEPVRIIFEDRTDVLQWNSKGKKYIVRVSCMAL